MEDVKVGGDGNEVGGDGNEKAGTEKVFTVEEAASILGCERRWVYHLIDEGWLKRPSGGSKKETGGRVTQKSLYQFVVADRLSHYPAKTLRMLRRERKLFKKSECIIAEANRYINRGEHKLAGTEGTNRTDRTNETNERVECLSSAETSCLNHNNSNQGTRALHYDFAERYQFSFAVRARQLAPDDLAMQDDLVQEMSLAVLEYDRAATIEFLFDIAFNRAKDYIKYEAARGMLSLEYARHVTDGLVEKMKSLDAFIDSLIERGVPLEWIEEVIGKRVDIA